MWVGATASERNYNKVSDFFTPNSCICKEGFEGANCEKETKDFPLMAVYDARAKPEKY